VQHRTIDESFLVLFFKKEPLARKRAKARKRFFLKKEAKTSPLILAQPATCASQSCKL
jgi:hypothetical protein